MELTSLSGKEIVQSGFDFTNPDFLSIKNWRVKKISHPVKSTHCYSIEWDNRSSIQTDSTTIHDNFKSIKNDLIYLQMAKSWSKNSHCKRMQVGCLMVKDKSIISDGYNGSPTGFPNICEDEDMTTLPYVLHAEANAITKLAKSTQSSDGSTIYVTLSPCFECSKLIIQSGIRRVVFSETYRKPDSIPFLIEAGIELVKINQFDQI
jgi:dCMP deaminase